MVSTVAAASDAPVTMKLRLFMLFWRMEDTVRAFLGGDRVQARQLAQVLAGPRRECWFCLQIPAKPIVKDFHSFLKEFLIRQHPSTSAIGIRSRAGANCRQWPDL